MFFPVSEWFATFVLTVAVEVPVVVLLVRRIEPDVGRLAILVVFADLVTHPAVWFIFTQVLTVGTPAYVVVVEAWAIGVEALFYAVTIPRIGWRRAIAVALVANAASFVIGRLVAQPWQEVFP